MGFPLNMSDVTPSESVSNIEYIENPKKKTASLVWKYFKVSEENKNKAICSLCPNHKNIFAYNNYGTKNLLTHLKNAHSNKFKENSESGHGQKVLDFTPFNQEAFDNQVVKWVINSGNPFSEDFTFAFTI